MYFTFGEIGRWTLYERIIMCLGPRTVYCPMDYIYWAMFYIRVMIQIQREAPSQNRIMYQFLPGHLMSHQYVSINSSIH